MSWLPKQTVVVPVDFSEESFAAVDTALEMVESAAHVHIIHVLPVLAAAEPGLVWDTLSDETRRENARRRIQEYVSDRPHQGCRVAVELGDPGSEIAAFAESVSADLIVLPSHGRTGLSRLLIGSVAERVCRLAHCPVLVLRQ